MAPPPVSKMSTRLAGLGSAKWAVHLEGVRRARASQDLIFLSIGEPDVAPPPAILDAMNDSLQRGRTRYAPSFGEPKVLSALGTHYTKQTGRTIGTDQFLFVPGTQTGLYVAMSTILEPGDEVLLFDPYYATYEGVVAAPGGIAKPVALDANAGFHLNLAAIEQAISNRTKAMLINSPSNPTGAVFTASEIEALGELAKRHNLWIVSDEVYANLTYGTARFVSPFFDPELEERTVVVSSISKSHALPGFRCGWIAASPAFVQHAGVLSETMLFGSQPFLEDATAFALTNHFDELDEMRNLYERRANALVRGLTDSAVKGRIPEGGMFGMLDVRATGLSGIQFAERLLDEESVVTMPGESFGSCGAGHIRIALTADEAAMEVAAKRIAALANRVV